MHITRFTDYSLRVLLYVALKGEELSTIREIAESYGISKNHLMKVVHELNLKGYLETVRGKHGGLRIRGRPEDINIGALVRTTEQDLVLVECFGNKNCCVITPACRLKNVLSEALEAFFSVLDRYTLADLLLTENRAALTQILRVDPPASLKAHPRTPAV